MIRQWRWQWFKLEGARNVISELKNIEVQVYPSRRSYPLAVNNTAFWEQRFFQSSRFHTILFAFDIYLGLPLHRCFIGRVMDWRSRSQPGTLILSYGNVKGMRRLLWHDSDSDAVLCHQYPSVPGTIPVPVPVPGTNEIPIPTTHQCILSLRWYWSRWYYCEYDTGA